ncbi:RNA polymerase sigma factor [Streptomyces sp. DH37]|uniref:RNA polymerase sigma factor n=1 Tax=Streptomyces sp. DH37 TaxID=3040122 RepID=UPI0024419C5F|nr:sigma-70 family RNA polymerase sigma factor [Streptomyces sp. DH37]MDG9700869.1 sigma-70 family RNA polymerase sigma factor [Streptomyces sp. DH37]
MAEERRDELLVVRCQLGEREAFGELVDRWHAPLWRYLRHMAGSAHTADDLAQEVWVAAVRGLPRLRDPARFAAWLFTIARRALADHLRHVYAAPRAPLPREEDITGDITRDIAGDIAEDGDGRLEEVLDRMEVRAGLDGLPPPEREVLILFHLEDLPLATCSAVLGVPVGTIKSRLVRARRMLRTTLTERGFEA